VYENHSKKFESNNIYSKTIAKKMPDPEGLAHTHNNKLILRKLIQQSLLHAHSNRGENMSGKSDMNGKKG